MSYGNVAGAGSYGNVAGAGSYGNGGGYSPGYGGGFTSLGVILVLFILLVIISRAWFF
ncbi:hypothetical protein D3C77_679260 [compost metagenome]